MEKSITKRLEKDIKTLEYKINHIKTFNLYTSVLKIIFKTGIAIDYAFPFLLISCLLFHSSNYKENKPFQKDQVTIFAEVESIDTSSGKHIEHVSYDYSYEEESLQHTTGWNVNEYGLYERTVTSYRIDSKVDLDDVDAIFAMTKEELENLLVVTNIEKIQKSTLSEEDSLFDTDAFILVTHEKSAHDYCVRLENVGEVALHSFVYLLWVLCYGNTTRLLFKLISKNRVRNFLKQQVYQYRKVQSSDLEVMKQILELKKENYLLLQDSNSSLCNQDGAIYSLRKEKKGE